MGKNISDRVPLATIPYIKLDSEYTRDARITLNCAQEVNGLKGILKRQMEPLILIDPNVCFLYLGISLDMFKLVISIFEDSQLDYHNGKYLFNFTECMSIPIFAACTIRYIFGVAPLSICSHFTVPWRLDQTSLQSSLEVGMTIMHHYLPVYNLPKTLEDWLAIADTFAAKGYFGILKSLDMLDGMEGGNYEEWKG